MPWLDQTQKDLANVLPIPKKQLAEKIGISLSNLVAALNDRRGIPKRAMQAFFRVVGYDSITGALLPGHVHHWVFDPAGEADYESAYRLATEFMSKGAQIGPIVRSEELYRDDYFCPIFDQGNLFIIYRAPIGWDLDDPTEKEKYEIWGGKLPFKQAKPKTLFLAENDFASLYSKFDNMKFTEKDVSEIMGQGKTELITWQKLIDILVKKGYSPSQVLQQLGIHDFDR